MELKITVRVRCNSIPLSDIHHITINMKNVYAFVYCDGDMIPSYKWIMFECPSDSKVIIIKEDMLLDALRKMIFYANGGCRILLYVGDGCVEYDYMEFKRDDDVKKIFFIYS